MIEKPSLKIYRNWRKEIGGQEEIYTNNQASDILIKARSNNLKLNDRNRFWSEDTKCDTCGAEKEDLGHFVLWCPTYWLQRGKSVRLQQPYIENEESVIGNYLFDKENIEEAKRTIHTFWKIREKKRKERRKQTQTVIRKGKHQGVPL